MKSFMGPDTASVELFFDIFTSGIETFVILWDKHLHPCVLEVSCLGLESRVTYLCLSVILKS